MMIAEPRGPMSPANPGRATAPPGEDMMPRMSTLWTPSPRIAKAAESELLTIAGE